MAKVDAAAVERFRNSPIVKRVRIGLLVFALILAIPLLFVVSFTARWPEGFWRSAAGQELTIATVQVLDPAKVPVVKKGAALPALTVTGLDGKPATIAAPPGKTLIVNFWATWCGPCLVEMPIIDKAVRGLGPDYQLVGVSIDGELKDVTDFLAVSEVGYPILWDAPSNTNSLARLGGSNKALPFTVLVDDQGRVRKRILRGFEEGELEAWVR